MMPAATPAEPLVVHDRKQHYAAVASSAATSDPTPRKATTADFLAPLQPAAVQPAANPVTASRAITTSQPLAAPILREAAAVPANQAARKAVQPEPILPTVRTPVAIAEKPAPIPPTVEPTLFTRNGRLILPPPLKGSHEILLRQNQVADREGLDRIQDDEDLERLRSAHLLVPIPVSTGIDADERLPANRRYVRPWTAQFLATLARAHYARFHSPLQVNSAVRTVEFQARLQLTNGNAAPAEGDTASPHLTGQAVDLAKHGLSLTQIAWMRGYLLPLVQEGKVDVEEEFQQACFHISVYKSYLPPPAQRRTLATAHHPNTALATAIR
jgi:hypothetical protein